jgi:hypothetical protein
MINDDNYKNSILREKKCTQDIGKEARLTLN